MSETGRAVWLTATALLASLSAHAQPASETLALTHVTVIDGTGSPARPDMTVVIQNGKITTVHASVGQPLPSGARVEDLSGKWLIPGLIDAHVHIAQDRGEIAPYSQLLGKLLLKGVTGVRDMAGDARILGYLAREARLDAPGWPDIYYSALMAGPTFFFEDARVAGASKGVLTGGAAWMRAVDSGTDIRLAVAEAKGTGATGIKLYANLPASLVQAITEEAHRQSMLVWTHAAIFPARPGDAVQAGVDSVSHTAYLAWEAATHIPPDYTQRAFADFTRIRTDDPRITALLDRMKARGTILDATLRVFQQTAGRSAEAAGPGILPWIYAVTRAAHEHGVLVDAGTDSQGLQSAKPDAGASVVDEMALLVKECGFTAEAAIQSATQVSAMVVGQGSLRGTVSKGMAADLVVLNADPVADIRNVEKIHSVYKDGKAFPAKAASAP